MKPIYLMCRAAKVESEPIIVKEKAKAKLKSGLGIARYQISLLSILLLHICIFGFVMKLTNINLKKTKK